MAPWGSVLFVLVAGAVVSAEAFSHAVAKGSSRIVSGWEAEEGQIPYQLSLRNVNAIGSVTACGGTIIHHEWGLTAAHCTATRVTIVMRGGVVNLTRPDLLFETTDYYNHPLYNEAIAGIVQPHDIGLLKFNRFIEYSDLVKPIRLQRSADKDRNYDGVRLMASGWGITWTGGSSPENMNWVYLLGDSNWVCWLSYGGSNIIQDSTICASAYNVSSQSTCQGDSGGPLVVEDVDGGLTQVGVASFVSGTGCHTNFPAGFIRPGHYLDWFQEVSGINFDWEPQEPESSDSDEEGSGFDGFHPVIEASEETGYWLWE